MIDEIGALVIIGENLERIGNLLEKLVEQGKERNEKLQQFNQNHDESRENSKRVVAALEAIEKGEDLS